MGLIDAATQRDILAKHVSERRAWSDADAAGVVAGLPNCPALAALLDETGVIVQVLTTATLRKLVQSRLERPEGLTRRADLSADVRGVAWREIHSAFEARWRFFLLACELYPAEYRRLIAFGPAWFLELGGTERIPEINMTDRIEPSAENWLGAWPTRSGAQQALEELVELFDLCRYPEQVRRAPAGTRCVYAELGACDAPCDGAAELSVYAARVRAAWGFALGNRAEALARIESAMRGDAGAQRFEAAARRKKQLETARRWPHPAPPSLRAAHDWNCVLAVPVIRRQAWKPFVFSRGRLVDGPVLPRRKFAAEGARSAIDIASKLPETAAGRAVEQTWLLAHLLDRPHPEAHIEWYTDAPPADLAERFASAIAAWKVRPDSSAEQAGLGSEPSSNTPMPLLTEPVQPSGE